MVKNIEVKHHITKSVIVGYGIADLIKNYNVHTMNETNDRKNFIPSDVDNEININEIIKGFSAKPVKVAEKPKVVSKPKIAPKPKIVSKPKIFGKKAKKVKK